MAETGNDQLPSSTQSATPPPTSLDHVEEPRCDPSGILSTNSSDLSQILDKNPPAFTRAHSFSSSIRPDLRDLLQNTVRASEIFEWDETYLGRSTINSFCQSKDLGKSKSGHSSCCPDQSQKRQYLSDNIKLEDQRHGESVAHIRSDRMMKTWEPEHLGKESLNSEITAVTGTTLRGSYSSSTPFETSADIERPGESCATGARSGMDDETPSPHQGNEVDMIYPKTLSLSFLMIGISLSVFLISLDRTIITTAIPFITNEFDSYDDIGWYGSAYLLTASAFQPLYGRVFMLFNMKWSYLTALGLFEAGSLLCGTAPSSVVLIIGRAIAGLGSAGILTGSFVIAAHTVPLAQRPVLSAIVGLVFGVGATVGPLLGGVFTDFVSWRWCFYINLPVGGATVAAMLFFFHPPKDHAIMKQPALRRILKLDLIGNALLLGASIQLFIAFQSTEQQASWSSAKVVGLLTGCGVTFIVFSIWQWWKAEAALIPPRILRQRSVAIACLTAFFIYSAILIHSYYLPIWFQAIRGDSAVQSGVKMIPYIAANAILSLLAGYFVSRNGYFALPSILGCGIGTIGCGLLSTINARTPILQIAAYEIVASIGIGMAIQQGFTAVQIALPLHEVSIGTAAVVAFQSLGGAIFVSVGNNILQNSLLSASRANKLPGVDVKAVINDGASAFRNHVPADQLPALISLYNRALQKVLIAAIPMTGLGMVSSLFFEWRNVQDTKRKQAGMEDAERRGQKAQPDGTVMETGELGPVIGEDDPIIVNK